MTNHSTLRIGLVGITLAALITAILLSTGPTPAAGSPLHPTFPLLDETGANVLETGAPVSLTQTCGTCHDTDFITSHSGHADAGLSDGAGLYTDWDPLTYHQPAGESLPAWVMETAPRHVGGGPAVALADGTPLTELIPSTNVPATAYTDPTTGEAVAWDWAASGVVEMNCLLCHTPNPNNTARVEAIQGGDFAWASTATLLETGIVRQNTTGLIYAPSAFDENGHVLPDLIAVGDPTSANCGACHGEAHTSALEPLTVENCSPADYTTLATGQVFSPQRVNASGLNIAGKQDLARPFDVHAERVLNCNDCHFSLNNPVYFRGSEAAQPEHLNFDPRRMDFGEYLFRPAHEFASASSEAFRGCDSCHDAAVSHEWLPYTERHMQVVACETCHIPQMTAPAAQSVDWTVITPQGEPVTDCRGIAEGDPTAPTTLITGYTPVLLTGVDGSDTLAPYNLITVWYWATNPEGTPIPKAALQAAWLDDDSYHPDVLAAFDADSDGALSHTELLIDSDEKQAVIATQLAGLGYPEATILAEVQPQAIHHGTVTGDYATRDCQACHSNDSVPAAALPLSGRVPGGVMPTFAGDTPPGEVVTAADGTIAFQPGVDADGLYIIGSDRAVWADWAGIAALVGALAGVTIHGGLRVFAARRRTEAPHHNTEDVYMYSVYERLWHWLQTAAIFILLATGLVIHRPDLFGFISFRWVVGVHNVTGALLIVNAALSLFYHLASGEIQQFLPRPRGFFDRAFAQVIYYVRGIFRDEPHPVAKTPQRKLNPLQQITYLMLLNVLLPLQIITGVLMWGVQRWPDVAMRVGGLPLLAPIHTLAAWLFAAFIVVHVYLTTTGHTPLAGVRSMMTGWDEVETHTETQAGR